jgi:hypothetical protein
MKKVGSKHVFSKRRTLVKEIAQIAVLFISITWILLSSACSQPDSQPTDEGSSLDTPFSKPQYLLHATGHGTMGGPVKDDWWFLFPGQPKEGSIELPDGSGGTFTYSIDQTSGPFSTPRAACQAASSAIGKSVSLSEWGSSQSFTCSDDASCQTECKERGSHMIWNGKEEYPYCNCICEGGFEFDSTGKKCVPVQTSGVNSCEAECKERDPHMIWNGKDEYPYCNCVCESGFEFDVTGKKCVPVQTSSANGNAAQALITTPQGTAPIKPGDEIRITLANGESMSLEVFCQEIQKKISLMSAIYGNSKIMYLEDVSFALGLLSANEYICGKRVTYDMDTSDPTGGSPVEVKIDLDEGPLRVEVVDDQAVLHVETPTVTVSSQGRNDFEVAYDPSSQKSYVVANQNPIQVQLTGSSQAPFTLEPGEEIEVSSGQVVPMTTQGQTQEGGATAQASGTAPEISQGGCYADPVTGEIVCVDSSGEPSTSQGGMEGGCYQDPETGEIVCVDSYEEPSTEEEGMQGGCYTDPTTGETICVDSYGDPSTFQGEMQGGCYQDPYTGQITCVDASGDLVDLDGWI